MANAALYDESGKSKGSVDLPVEIFGQEVNEHLLYESVRNYLANQRSGTAHTKDRSEVEGSTRKLFRQKGTGRARAGSVKSPIRRGGGTAFGPKTRDFRYKLPVKARRRALYSALSDRASEESILVIDGLAMEEPKTSRFVELLAAMGLQDRKVLLVLDEYEPNVCKSARNIRNLDFIVGRELNAYQVLWADKVVMTSSALEQVQEVFGS
ncbi:MAG: 50S ribosomal protein L4 [Candidatus Krumholzibacteria bacterium]|jgi:large subunit ribosomal protein L4|nr:50S ribosomal protein L4 [Candidatus Krumholzibacteria bacterium]MDP6798133.1 50S ribosomal protein L4 [Candidatus Krumholzibacteria bacterium]MDP7022073.1 50S ribosomal protein L4 [Candidatus Krumholzibacteria bacterium]